MDTDNCENMTPFISDADIDAAADEQFQLDEEYESRRRHAPRIRRDIPISDEDWEAGLQEIKDNQARYRASMERASR